MKLGIITATEKGVAKAFKIKEKIDCDIYTFGKFMTEKNGMKTILIDGKLKDFLGSIFDKYNTFLFITATGIAIRTIAPYIKSKDKDPAILSMDEQGNFIIPLLSGHLGKANERANFLGKITGAFPIITTASDVSGKIAVDTLAMKINGELDSLENAKKVTSLIVAGKNVSIKVPKNISDENPSGVIIVSNRENIETTQIIPKNIIIGIGCKKNKESKLIINAIKDTLQKLNLSKKSIRFFATGDIKEKEVGIIEASLYFDRELKIVSRDDIKKIQDDFETSEFVKKITGVGAISAPAAKIASGRNGKFLAKKLKYDGITISIFEENTEKGENI